MSAQQPITWAQLRYIDDKKAWRFILQQDREALMLMLARTLKQIPVSELEGLFRDYALPHQLGGAKPQDKLPLRAEVQRFCAAALRGDYYEDFNVNSQNFMNKSKGTQRFGAELKLLWERCIREAETEEPSEICAAYELLFELLIEIDTFEKDILFWGDEGGIWQLGTNWLKVLPPYFACLAKRVPQEEFVNRARALIETFEPTDNRTLTRVVNQLSSGHQLSLGANPV